MPQIETDTLLGDLKKFRVAKSDLTQCFVCMHPSPHSMRVQRLACACKACAKVTTTAVCPWRARVMTCQQTLLVTIEEAYAHATPARSARKPVLTHAMKTVVMDWAAQGLKPKRIWNALVQRFDLNDTSTSTLVTVQRFVHHHVAERLGGSDLRDTVRRKVQETFFTGQEEETAAFTFTRRTNVNGNAVVGNGSNADPFVIGVSAKKLLRRADRDPASFILHSKALPSLGGLHCLAAATRAAHGRSSFTYVAKMVFEKTRSMVAASAASVMADIHDLHFTTSEAAFHEKLAEVQERWAKSKDLSVFSKYFSKVWLNQRFWRWQCFHTPCGYATTNNPCET
ncbi:hypothetical protein PC111_g12344 [Phytophthora cactorum]|nr:hypothetical protein PC111_g12344 [Phytophthora cactorum]KAG2906839.1 hypothetical protein PC114_g11010 [Phytophthora cactorum]